MFHALHNDDYQEDTADYEESNPLLAQQLSDREQDDASEANSSDMEPSLRNVFCDESTCSFFTVILHKAVPASLSAVLGQVTYLINFIVAGQTIEAKELAGLCLGHALSQFFGIMILLGLQSGL